MQVSGTAISTRSKQATTASVIRITRAMIGSHPRKGFTLTPGINNKQRSTVVQGSTIGDVPTRYTIFGLEPYELPVIGKQFVSLFPLENKSDIVNFLVFI